MPVNSHFRKEQRLCVTTSEEEPAFIGVRGRLYVKTG